MRVEFTGRHIEITEPIRQFALDRLERLRSLHDIIEAHFVLTAEKHQRHMAEINLKTRNDFHHCADTTNDMYTSIASVLDKLERQVEKSKTREVRKRRRAENPRVAEAESIAAAEPESDELPQIVRADTSGARPLSVEEAATDLASGSGSFMVFRNTRTERLNVVYKRGDGDIAWLEPEQ